MTDGILLVDKPAGFTSHDLVAIARGATGIRRVGHTGTLDPFATGLLVMLVGQATRLAQYVDGEPKVYETTIAFGAETDTDDVTGTVTRTAPPPDAAAIDAAIVTLTGEMDQLPPDYSAKQSGGVRAYDAARKGAPLALETARVTVHRWTILSRDETTLTARIECSGGTYIRSLGRDLGRLTGSAAHLASLRRVASGRFSVDQACSLESLRARKCVLLDMRQAIASLPVQTLAPDDLVRVGHGNPVSATVGGERAALVTAEGRLVAIAARNGENWQPATVFPHA
ncbi:MAG TPA: tRNA pseudouridine(55) synthase TruB [Gemmatimonadaceae bacterium]|nr:tRNA pseudouridine(55) synthase TruB [Gemmatimonadaceae bacterium]